MEKSDSPKKGTTRLIMGWFGGGRKTGKDSFKKGEGRKKIVSLVVPPGQILLK